MSPNELADKLFCALKLTVDEYDEKGADHATIMYALKRLQLYEVWLMASDGEAGVTVEHLL